jgi:DNA-binding response OmpR family regulator
VDDDARFAGVLSAALGPLGHECVIVAPERALEMVAARPFDLAVVDADSDAGRAFLADYRRAAPNLAAVVTTSAATVETAVEMLRGGDAAPALDYIEKPAADLARRIDEAVYRHRTRIERGRWVADAQARHGYYDGNSLELTEHEYDVFRVFMEAPHRWLPYRDIARSVYGRDMTDAEAYTALRSIVSRLRKKMKAAAGRDMLSRHIEGAGIRFVPGGIGRRRDTSR